MRDVLRYVAIVLISVVVGPFVGNIFAGTFANPLDRPYSRRYIGGLAFGTTTILMSRAAAKWLGMPSRPEVAMVLVGLFALSTVNNLIQINNAMRASSHDTKVYNSLIELRRARLMQDLAALVSAIFVSVLVYSPVAS